MALYLQFKYNKANRMSYTFAKLENIPLDDEKREVLLIDFTDSNSFSSQIEGVTPEQLYAATSFKLTYWQQIQLSEQISNYIETASADALAKSNIIFWITCLLKLAIENQKLDLVNNAHSFFKKVYVKNPAVLIHSMQQVQTHGPYKGWTVGHTWVHQFISIVSNSDVNSFVLLADIVDILMTGSKTAFFKAITTLGQGEVYMAGKSGISSIVFALTDSAKNPYNQVMTSKLAYLLKDICQQSPQAVDLITNTKYMSGVSLLIDLCALLNSSVINNEGLTEVVCEIIKTLISVPSTQIGDKIHNHFLKPIAKGRYAELSNFLLILQGLQRAANQPNGEGERQFNHLLELTMFIYENTPTSHKKSLLTEICVLKSKSQENGIQSLLSILFSAITNHYDAEKCARFINNFIHFSEVENFLTGKQAEILSPEQYRFLLNYLSKFDPTKFPSLRQYIEKQYNSSDQFPENSQGKSPIESSLSSNTFFQSTTLDTSNDVLETDEIQKPPN